MASGKSRIDVRKLRARCRHFRFASRSLDDWRRLGPPASAVIRTAVLHLHLETRAVEVEVSPCRVCVFGPSVGSTTCQHNGGDEENAGHRSGVVWEREERRRGCTLRRLHGEEKAATPTKRKRHALPGEETSEERVWNNENHNSRRLPKNRHAAFFPSSPSQLPIGKVQPLNFSLAQVAIRFRV